MREVLLAGKRTKQHNREQEPHPDGHRLMLTITAKGEKRGN